MKSVRSSTLIATVACLGLFLVLAAGVHQVVQSERARVELERRNEVQRQAAALLSRIDSELKGDVFLANGLLAHVSAMRGHLDESINDALRALHRHGRHIRNIGVAPGNRVSHVYPLDGNQAALGLYYPDSPQQWPAIKTAMETRQTTMAGPLKLRQGGIGLVSRTPVFLEDGRYWGVLSLVIDASELFAAAGVEPEVDGIRYALRGRDGLGERGEVFFGDGALFTTDSIVLTLSVPGGAWQLAALPVAGWGATRLPLGAAEASGIVAAALLALLAFAYHRGRSALVAKERRLRTFLETTRDGVIIIDEHGMVREFNPAAEQLFGYVRAEVVGATVNRLMPAAEAAAHDGYMRRRAHPGTRMMGGGRQVFGRRKDGSEFPIEVSVGEAEDSSGRLHVGIVRDITERKAFERKLMELATIDGLTGALNRRAFLEVAENAFRLAQRYDRPLSVLMIDADHFKLVNDTHGHHVGDLVLARLAQICRQGLRATDSFGRLGGEEFVALLPETDLAHAREVAERLVQAVREARVEPGDGRVVTFTISVGITCAQWSSRDIDAVIQAADQQLYRAKNEGRDRVCG